MRRRTLNPLLATAAAAALLTGLGLTLTSGPAVATTTDDVLPADVGSLPDGAVDALKRDLDLSSDKAVQARLDIDALATNVTRRADRIGTHYAGTWVSDDGSKVVVAVDDKSAVGAAKNTGATTVQVVDQSLADLDAVKADLDDQSDEASKNVTSWYVDPATNSVVVAATTQAAADAFVAASGVDPASVTTTIDVARPQTASDIRGGDEYRKPSGGGYVLCSIGFAVQGGGFVSAGHCGNAGEAVNDINNNALGTYQASTFPGHDYSWVKTNSNWAPTGQVNNYSGGNWIPVFGSTEAAVGASVCRSGRTTQWQCGVIEATNVTIHYSAGDVTGAVRMTACAAGGDSGGSVISGNDAQGVMSGVSGDCGTAGARSFYQPVNPILSQYNLKLALGTAIQGYNDKCIDVPSSDFSDSRQLQIYTCNGTNAQAFRFRANGTIEVGGKCMDLRQSNTNDGNAVQIYTCNGTQAQQFTLNGAGDLVSVLANKCVDVKDWNGNNGGLLQIWTCGGTANQKWHKH